MKLSLTPSCPALDPPRADLIKSPNTSAGHENFIPTKFHKHPSSGSVVKADYVCSHVLVHPPFFHLNKHIKFSLKFFKKKSTENLTSEWKQKHYPFFPPAFRSLLCIRFVTVAFQSEEAVLWRRNPSLTYFAQPWIHPWAGFAEKSIYKCGAMSTSSLPSFINIHQAVL